MQESAKDQVEKLRKEQEMAKQEIIEGLKFSIKCDERAYSDLISERLKLDDQIKKLWSRKYDNKVKLSKLMGVDGILS